MPADGQGEGERGRWIEEEITRESVNFGMLPMATGTGLGSELRASIGIGSVGGILVSSVVSLYFIPAFYVLVGQSDKSQSRRIKKDIDNIPDPVVSAEVEM